MKQHNTTQRYSMCPGSPTLGRGYEIYVKIMASQCQLLLLSADQSDLEPIASLSQK